MLSLTGLSLDSIYNTPSGFHTFALITCYLIAKDWLHSGENGELLRPYFLQVIANLLISISLFLVLQFQHGLIGTWMIPNIVVDVFVSTLLFAVIAPWFSGLCRECLKVTYSSEKINGVESLKVLEKYHPEARRLILFRIIYAFMLTVLCSVLSYRQLFEADEYETKERQQGQRRIIRPGARGDVLDRNGELLIGKPGKFFSHFTHGTTQK